MQGWSLSYEEEKKKRREKEEGWQPNQRSVDFRGAVMCLRAGRGRCPSAPAIGAVACLLVGLSQAFLPPPPLAGLSRRINIGAHGRIAGGRRSIANGGILMVQEGDMMVPCPPTPPLRMLLTMRWPIARLGAAASSGGLGVAACLRIRPMPLTRSLLSFGTRPGRARREWGRLSRPRDDRGQRGGRAFGSSEHAWL